VLRPWDLKTVARPERWRQPGQAECFVRAELCKPVEVEVQAHKPLFSLRTRLLKALPCSLRQRNQLSLFSYFKLHTNVCRFDVAIGLRVSEKK
jgi:hypothetical protein